MGFFPISTMIEVEGPKPEAMKSDIREVVKEKYGEAAQRARAGASSCCGTPSHCQPDGDPVTANLYNDAGKTLVPEQAVLASLGCGNPTALAELNPGETVLDLGSGGDGVAPLVEGKFASSFIRARKPAHA